MATPRAHRIVRTLAATAAAAVLAGCASAPLDSARMDFRQGQLARAEETLVKKADEVQPKDRVLHMMERGTIRQARGHYEDSSHDFIAAADRIRELETYSASKGVASLVVNDTVQDFRGAPYERTLLHAMTALNHFAVTNWDNAAVESRRMHRRAGLGGLCAAWGGPAGGAGEGGLVRGLRPAFEEPGGAAV